MFGNFKKTLWGRELRTWYLYDGANSFISMAMTLYFSQWVIVDQHLTDFWLALPFIIATIILIFISTHVGAIGDRLGNHNRIFVWTTFASMAAVVLTIMCGRFLAPPWGVVLALLFYGLYQFFVQLALVPYYAFIKHIAPAEDYGKISGLGFTVSQGGSIGLLLLSLLIVSGKLLFFGTDRLAPVVLGLVLFALFFVPTLLVFGRKKVPATPVEEKPFWRSFVGNLLESRKYPGVFPLLLSYYFFIDAIATLSLFSAVFLEKVFQVPDTMKASIYILVLVGLALGAFLAGPLSDRITHRRTLVWALFFEGLSILGVALAHSIPVIAVAFFFFGFMMGAVYASSRAYLASLIPAEESGKYFGLYTFAERFASVAGPLVWGIIIWVLAAYDPLNYRIAAVAMGVITLIALLPLVQWRTSSRVV